MKYNLKGRTLDELKLYFEQKGFPAYRASQVYSWIIKGAASFEEMTDLPKKLREELSKTCSLPDFEEVNKKVSCDGTIKYLFKLPDDNVIEAVLMKYEYGNSACLSTQVGCKMGCGFCASTIGGHVRNLEVWEIVNQVGYMQKNIDDNKRISRIVLMGTGEPLENFDNVIKALHLLNHGYGISYRRMTLSTCGIVPKIFELADTNIPITLTVSLHAPNDEIRDRLMPINRVYPIKLLINACEYYINKTRRRVTFEYSLIKDVNDSLENAKQLASLLSGILCHVNLINLNPVTERSYRMSSRQTANQFRDTLKSIGIPATVRRELGRDIDAACGQLRHRYIKHSDDINIT